jgi:cyclic-di-AMP phosphodiesterase PgpH
LLRAMAAQQGQQIRTRAAIGTGSFVMLLCAVVYLFGARRVFRRSLRTRDLVFLSTLLVLALSFIVAADALNPLLQRRFPALPTQALFLAVPLAFGAMQVRLTLTSDVALLFSIVFALLGGVVVDPGMTWAITAVLASLTGAAGVAQSTRGSKVILAGLGAGVVATGASVTLELFRGTLVGTQLLWLAAASMVGGLLSGVLAVSWTPVFESVFGFVTDMKLRRLSDLNQPLLKELIVHAPGTWHHSIRTAVLAEKAATAVGGSALLARTMALYHDVGKMKAPQWFGENQKGDNPHDRAPPARSAEVLRGHVQDGLELARKHRLPRAVSVAIEEHHGDDLMEGFYVKAVSAAAEEGESEVMGPQHALVDEKAFRYTGRLPQTKESAVVMLADRIEAASRALKDPTPDRLCDLVEAFIARALADDALADCELSMRDLSRVRDAFQRALLRMFQALPDDDASIPPGDGGAEDALRAPRR